MTTKTRPFIHLETIQFHTACGTTGTLLYTRDVQSVTCPQCIGYMELQPA